MGKEKINTINTIKTQLVQMDVLPGRPVENTTKMINYILEARKEKIELIVFPELVIPGYLIGDEWERTSFVKECEVCGQKIREASENIIVVFGNVGVDWKKKNEDGRIRKYNALFIAENGEFIGSENTPYNFVIKALLPNYREFDDSRHFFDLRKLALEEGQSVEDLAGPIKTSKVLLGCVLCEDAWNMDYSFSPIDTLANNKHIDLFINISSSPFTLNKNHKRNRVFSAQATKLKRPLIYVNNTGIQNNGKTVFAFDGSSCIYDSHGHSVLCGDTFTESSLIFDIPISDSTLFGTPLVLKHDGIKDIYKAIDYGTRNFMDLCGIKRIVIGVSGGIDSAVVAAIYSRIVDPENLLLVNMPSSFNSKTTCNLAKTIANNIGCYYADIPIDDSVLLTRGQIEGVELGSRKNISCKLNLSELMLENIQARDRSSRILAAVSAAFGGVFTCNANKSEITVGYTTIYGDLSGYLANIADLWKTEVYELAHYLNKYIFNEEIIPQGTIDIIPSAELSDNQNIDEGKGDPLIYPYHDLLFKSWVEWWDRVTPEEILLWYTEDILEDKLGYNGCISDLFETSVGFITDLERWWNLYQGMGLAKRIQAPPILAVKKRAFGFDHRESQMGVRYSDKYRELRERTIEQNGYRNC